MSASRRLAALAVAAAFLMPVGANAMEEYLRASSSKRTMSASSTARLFPARPSPDIDNLGGSIR